MLRRTLVFGLLLYTSTSIYAQLFSDNLSLEVRYPIPAGDNFLANAFGNNHYNGIIDLGVDYNVIDKNGLGFGVAFNSSFLKLDENNINLTVLSPKLKIEYEIDLNKVIIIPQLAAGYSNWRYVSNDFTYYDEQGNLHTDGSYKESNNGLTLQGGTKIMWNTGKALNYYVSFYYEYTELSMKGRNVLDIDYNKKLQLLYPGLGVNWRFDS